MVINELVTNPRDVDWDGSGQPLQAQWLELYNTTDASICLAFWRVTTADQAHPATLPAGQCMSAHDYLAIFRRDIGLDLKQGPISLLDANGRVVDSVSPPVLMPDYGYARIPDGSGNWVVTSRPTLRSTNVVPADPTTTPSRQATVFAVDDDSPDATDAKEGRHARAKPRRGQPFQELSIADVRGLPDDTAVLTSGVITMPTGLWELDRAYIQANGAGILIHSYGGAPLRLGDTLTIRGRVHHVRGEVEIAAVKGGEAVTAGGELPAPRVILPGAMGPATEALLVQIAGRVDVVEREYATVGDDGGSGRVFLYSRLAFAASSLRGIAGVTITGVVNAAESAAIEPSERTYAQRLLVSSHRLVPRLVGDIRVQATPPSPSAPESAAPGGEPVQARVQALPAVAGGVSSTSAGATATPFVTPVLSSSRGAGARPQPAVAAPNVLVLAQRQAADLPWLWIGISLGLLLLVGGGVLAVFGPRWFRKTED